MRTHMAQREDPVLTVDELAGELRITPSTIYSWRFRGQGPEGFRVGGAVRYRRSAIDRWLAECGDTTVKGQY